MPPLFSARRRWLAAAILGIALGQAVLGILGSLALTGILRSVSNPSVAMSGPVTWFCLVAGLLAGLEWLKRVATEAMGLDVARDIRMTLLEGLLIRPVFVPARSHASTMLPFMGDLTALRQWVSDGIARGVVALLILICLAAWIEIQCPKLGLALLAPLFLTAGAMVWVCRPLYDSARRQRTLRGRLATRIDDRVRHALTVRAMGSEGRELKQMARRIDALNGVSLQRASNVGRLRAAAMLGGQMVVLAGFAFGAVLVRAGEIDLHTLIGLMSLTGLIAAALSDLARAAELAVPGLIAWRRLRGRMAESHMLAARTPGRRHRAESGLVVDAFRPHSASVPFSAGVQPGEIVLLEGGSSAHRTQTVLALAGLAPHAGGRVRMDGRPVQDLKPSRRRSLIGIASPAVPLLRESIGRHIASRLRGGSQAAAAALARDLAPLTPAIAVVIRAMAGRPRLLLLDGIDAGLTPDQLEAMIDYLRHWPGVVILTSCTRSLSDCATRRWRLADDGLAEEPSPADTSVIHLFPRI